MSTQSCILTYKCEHSVGLSIANIAYMYVRWVLKMYPEK